MRRTQAESIHAGFTGAGIRTSAGRASPGRTSAGLLPRLRAAEAQVIRNLRRISLPLLRLAIGTVFLWFGALKAINASPVNDLVAKTVPWVDPDLLFPALGVLEMTIGVALIAGRLLTLVCAVLIGHLSGTFLSLIMQPGVTFQDGNPLILTTEGEFVMKNLVFIAAGLVIAARYQSQDRAQD